MNEEAAFEMLRMDPVLMMDCLKSELIAYIEETDRDGVIIGVSGGLDSAVAAAACAKILEPERVKGVHMPDKDSLPQNTDDAKAIKEHLGIDLRIVDLTPTLKTLGVYQSFGDIPTEKLREIVEQENRRQGKEEGRKYFIERLKTTKNPYIALSLSYAFTKHAVRAVVLHMLGKRENLAVINTSNWSETSIGYISDLGPDNTGDFALLNSLYRTQVEILAEYLGLPEKIRNKPSDTDSIPGAHDKVKFMFMDSWIHLDGILYYLEDGLDKDRIANLLEVDIADVEYVETLVNLQTNKKRTPYIPTLITI
ncbi:MAG: hypothetical protein ACETWM_08430 [Candidatus Lokiarchaeia archaeon]